MNKPIKVLIADDEELFALGAKVALESYPEIELDVTMVTETSDEVIEKVGDSKFDILFIDLDWFGEQTAGEEVIKKIHNIKPQLPIIAISAYPTLIEPARNAGARKARTKQGLTGRAILNLIMNILATDEILEISDKIKEAQIELTGLESVKKLDASIQEIKITGMKKTLEGHYRRLRALKEKLAFLGTSADPALKIEVEDIEQKIAEIEKELSRFEKGGE